MKPRFQTLSSFQRWLFTPLRWFLKSFFPLTYLHWQYRFITGHPLNLKHPKRYTEKLQYLRWYVYPKNPLVIQASDRVGLRTYVTQLGLSEYLVPIEGIYELNETLPFSTFHRPYVIKATHGSNMNYFVWKQEDEQPKKIQRLMAKWLKTDYGKKTLEPHYSKIKPRIIVEKFIKSSTPFPIEYKIHVFHGIAKFLYVVTGRGADIRYTLFDRDWLPFDGAQFNGWNKSDTPLEKPLVFSEMLTLAETLGKAFPFVRVDLYEVVGKIYVSELTFTPAKGTLKLTDDSLDRVIGNWIHLDE